MRCKCRSIVTREFSFYGRCTNKECNRMNFFNIGDDTDSHLEDQYNSLINRINNASYNEYSDLAAELSELDYKNSEEIAEMMKEERDFFEDVDIAKDQLNNNQFVSKKEVEQTIRSLKSNPLCNESLIAQLQRICDQMPEENNAQLNPSNITSTNDSKLSFFMDRLEEAVQEKNRGDILFYVQKVLDLSPNNEQAYIYWLLADCNVSSFEELQYINSPFNEKESYKQLLQVASDQTKFKLKEALSHIMENWVYDGTNVPEKGETLLFGKYYIHNHQDKSRLEWIVLKKLPDKALIITKEIVAFQPLHRLDDSINYLQSDLRNNWMQEFVSQAFNKNESENILSINKSASNNHKYNVYNGVEVNDPVFILSIEEVAECFENDKSRKTTATYCARNDGGIHDEKISWWLRTPGFIDFYSATIDEDGEINYEGELNTKGEIGVRPACWIRVK